MGNYRVLVVDDEADNVFVMKEVASRDGYEVFTASNGQEGLDVFIDKSPQIVITDYRMPIMNGLELIERVKRIKPEAVVIFTSGVLNRNLVERAEMLGVLECLEKPIQIRDLKATIEKAVREVELNKERAHYDDSC